MIEVSDSSLAYDREIKLPLYAGAGIPEAWIVDINSGAIIRYAKPARGRYTTTETAGPGMRIASSVPPGLTIEVDALLDH